MAQEKESRRDSSKADDYEFIPPDFDEDSFIHKEIVSFRTTLILFVWGVVAALVSWAAFAGLHGSSTGWLVGLAICAIFGYALKPIFPRLKADISHFGKREWLGTALLFFLTWLAFFILVINPPVSDFAPPRVDLHSSLPYQLPGQPFSIDMFVGDNVGVANHEFQISHNGTVIAQSSDLTDLGSGHFVYQIAAAQPGSYEIHANGTDVNHHSSQNGIDVQAMPGLLTYSATMKPESKGTVLDRVVIQTGDCRAATEKGASTIPCLEHCSTKKGVVSSRPPCVRSVLLEFTDRPGNVTLSWGYKDLAGKNFSGWTATQENAGWMAGNNTFDVVAAFAGDNANNLHLDGGTMSTGPFTVYVGNPGAKVVQAAVDPLPHHRVPSVDMPVLVVGLLGLVALARRKR